RSRGGRPGWIEHRGADLPVGRRGARARPAPRGHGRGGRRSGARWRPRHPRRRRARRRSVRALSQVRPREKSVSRFWGLVPPMLSARVARGGGMRKSSLAWLFALAVGTAGCDGSTDPDAGASDAQVPAEDARVDAGNEQPSEPPRVTSTRPRNGEMEVAGDRELEVRFSAPMSASAGTVRARVGTTDIPLGATTW